MRYRRGFSLLEVAVVLGVLAVMLGAAAKSAQTWRQGQGVWRTTRDVQTMAEALRRYRLDTGAWPAQLTDLGGSYLPSGASFQTAWGDAVGYTASGTGVVLTVDVPMGSAAANGGGALETNSDLGAGRRRLTLFVPRPGDVADLAYARNQIAGGTQD